MPKGKLFESWTFKQTMPEPFDDPQYSGQKDFGRSRYNSAGAVPKASLHAPSLRAINAYARLVLATEAGSDTTGLGALGQQGTQYRIGEYRTDDKCDCVVFNPNTGKFIAGRFENGSDTPKPYTLGNGTASGAALLFALMPALDEDSEFHDNFAEYMNELQAGFPDIDSAFNTALTLCDNIYRRIENCQNVGQAGVKLAIPATGNVSLLSPLAIGNGSYAPTGTLYGDFEVLKPNGNITQAVKAYAHEDFVDKYELSPRTLTAREEAMVPKLADWYIIPKEVVRVCEHALKTTGSSQPMRNFMLRGEAGTGKTMGAQAVAAGLHLPYTHMTCNANTEITDLIGQFIPDPAVSAMRGQADSGELPKIADIVMHPPSVYQMLTGEYDEAKTEDDVLQKLVDISVARLMRKEQEGGGQRIRYVDSPLIEAIRYGYVCELQEPSCITNPGVLVGLNALLDNCQSITLPTGERVERHPDTVIIVTTNANYAGCRDVNQSIISRMELIFDTQAPDLSTMVKRVMNITGCTDEQETTKMALVVRDMADRCRQTMITDGSVGMRELKAWVQSTMVTGDPYESALATVISSASADEDNRADLITTCLEKQYSRSF